MLEFINLECHIRACPYNFLSKALRTIFDFSIYKLDYGSTIGYLE